MITNHVDAQQRNICANRISSVLNTIMPLRFYVYKLFNRNVYSHNVVVMKKLQKKIVNEFGMR